MTTGGDSQRINRHSVSLEVSRALGDPLFKHGYNPLLAPHGKDIVSPLPDVTVYDYGTHKPYDKDREVAKKIGDDDVMLRWQPTACSSGEQ